MRARTREALSLAVGLGLMTLLACSHPKPVVAPPVQAPSASQPEPAGAPAPSGTQSISSEPSLTPAQSPETGIASSELPADLTELNKAGYLKDVFFDTNASDLSAEARDTLAADAAWLNAHPSVTITIEGHADERNTEEYNLALGWRRANATKDYLVSLGVAASRVNTISYGEERPFATGHSESAWAQNRRAHLVITAR